MEENVSSSWQIPPFVSLFDCEKKDIQKETCITCRESVAKKIGDFLLFIVFTSRRTF